jgi:iron complex outermembrane receptor protein
VKIEGWDSSAQYQFPLADLLQVSDEIGDINLRVDVTRQYHWKLQGLPGQAFTELANAIPNATPEWKANMAATWAGEAARAVADPLHRLHGRGDAVHPGLVAQSVLHGRSLRARRARDLPLQRPDLVPRRRRERDQRAPAVPARDFTGTGTGSSTYDNRGRFFFIGASMTY